MPGATGNHQVQKTTVARNRLNPAKRNLKPDRSQGKLPEDLVEMRGESRNAPTDSADEASIRRVLAPERVKEMKGIIAGLCGGLGGLRWCKRSTAARRST